MKIYTRNKINIQTYIGYFLRMNNNSITDISLVQFIKSNKSNIDLKLKLRCLVVKQFLKGISARKIAETFIISKDTVYYWHKRFINEGIDGLKTKPKSGRPRKIDVVELEKVLLRSPQEYGIDEQQWNIESIQKYIEIVQKIKIHKNYIYQVLRKLAWKPGKTENKYITKDRTSLFLYPQTSSGQRVTETHLQMMKNVARILDAPIHKILEKGVQPVLKAIYSDKDTTILEGKTEQGILTIKYEEFSS